MRWLGNPRFVRAVKSIGMSDTVLRGGIAGIGGEGPADRGERPASEVRATRRATTVSDERTIEQLTREWYARGLGRRQLLRLLAAGAGTSAIAAVLAACGTRTWPSSKTSGSLIRSSMRSVSPQMSLVKVIERQAAQMWV